MDIVDYSYPQHRIVWKCINGTGTVVPTLDLLQNPVLKGILIVRVHGAEELHHINPLLGSLSPYLEVKIGTMKQRTDTVKKGGKNVNWNSTLQFNLSGEETSLRVKVFHKSAMGASEVGMCRVQLRDLIQLHGLDIVREKRHKATNANNTTNKYSERYSSLPESVVFTSPKKGTKKVLRQKFKDDHAVNASTKGKQSQNTSSNSDNDSPPKRKRANSNSGVESLTTPSAMSHMETKTQIPFDELNEEAAAVFQLMHAGHADGGRVRLSFQFFPTDVNDLYREKTGVAIQAPEATRVFGVPLAVAVKKASTVFPRVLLECVEYIRDGRMGTEGLFRVMGNTDELAAFQRAFDRDDPVEFDSAHDASGILKRYLRELPESIVPMSLYERMLEVEDRETSSAETRYNELKALMNLIPKLNRDALSYLCGFLMEVVQEPDNKMDSHSLAICMSPNIIRIADMASNTDTKDPQLMKRQYDLATKCVESFINGYETIFDIKVIQLDTSQDDTTTATAAASTTTKKQRHGSSKSDSKSSKRSSAAKSNGGSSSLKPSSSAKAKGTRKSVMKPRRSVAAPVGGRKRTIKKK